MSARRRYSVTVGDPSEQARLHRGARLLGHRSMSSFFKTAALAYLDIDALKTELEERTATGAQLRQVPQVPGPI